MVAYKMTLKHDDEDIWIVVEAETGVPTLAVPYLWDHAMNMNGVLDKEAVWEARYKMINLANILRKLGHHVVEHDWTMGEVME